MIEMMIATTVLVVALLSTMVSQMSAHSLLRTSQDTESALTDLQAAMERALSAPFDNLPTAGSEFAHGQSIARFEGTHLRNQRIVATYPGYVAGGAVPDPLPIVMTITWSDDKGRPRSLSLASMRTR
jgi:hypothetical protein